MNWDAVVARPLRWNRQKEFTAESCADHPQRGWNALESKSGLVGQTWSTECMGLGEEQITWKALSMANGTEWLTTNNSISKFKSSKCVCLLLGKNQRWYLTEKEIWKSRESRCLLARGNASQERWNLRSLVPAPLRPVHAHPPRCLCRLKAVRRMNQGCAKTQLEPESSISDQETPVH